MKELWVETAQREEIIDITSLAAELAARENWTNGALMLFCPHTTCGLTVNESADPDVRRDLKRFFGEIAPRAHNWLHREGNTDAHIRASLLGCSLLLPLAQGRLRLGTWQAVYLYEGDGPRRRSIWAQFLAEPGAA